MPIKPTFPGVYIEEIPSGVRTIIGVSTSVTAFIGSAKRGPINKATRILSFADYERRFGGLAADSETSYAVRQFFVNGGSEAWMVRLAKDAAAASHNLQNSAAVPIDVLKITALDEGKTGNDIEVRINYQTGNPASTFNLILNYTSKDNPAESKTETFENLSMNSQDPRYVEDLVNGVSELVKVERIVPAATLAGLTTNGTSVSGDLVDIGGTLLDVSTLVDATHNQFRVSANGLPAVTVLLAAADVSGADPVARLATLCGAIQTKVQAQDGGNPALSAFACAPDGNKIKMTSGAGGEASSVRVLAGTSNDATARLKLGVLNGGVEIEAMAQFRPAEIPAHGSLASGAFVAADLAALPDATHTSFQISLDGYGPDTISIGGAVAAGADLAAKLGDVAARIQAAVRALKPANPAYKDFTCTVDATNNKLVLASGTRGAGSSVMVSAAPSSSIANELHLLTGITTTQPANVMLQNGNENPFTDAEAYNLFIADRSQRRGIYALEAVDIFNLLCLPGITDSGILQDTDAYCKERRAFLIADAPKEKKTPDQMVSAISGPALPKTDYGAVYYPWIKIADPLKNGKLRTHPPSGTIAGLYARTDTERGVWKAPAGTDATLRGVQATEHQLTDGENGSLNPLGVNCVRIFPVHGAVAWGSRTLRGADQAASEYKYVPVRRLALFIEESLYRGTQWAVFEPNDEPLWAQIRLNLGAFMNNLFRQGAFQGKTPAEAYFVKCDKETTTQNDINLGIINIIVGFAPLKPAEFVIIKIQQMAGQIAT
ncbi:MAG: phage tail sheath family protein [bacterium]